MKAHAVPKQIPTLCIERTIQRAIIHTLQVISIFFRFLNLLQMYNKFFRNSHDNGQNLYIGTSIPMILLEMVKPTCENKYFTCCFFSQLCNTRENKAIAKITRSMVQVCGI